MQRKYPVRQPRAGGAPRPKLLRPSTRLHISCNGSGHLGCQNHYKAGFCSTGIQLYIYIYIYVYIKVIRQIGPKRPQRHYKYVFLYIQSLIGSCLILGGYRDSMNQSILRKNFPTLAIMIHLNEAYYFK